MIRCDQTITNTDFIFHIRKGLPGAYTSFFTKSLRGWHTKHILEACAHSVYILSVNHHPRLVLFFLKQTSAHIHARVLNITAKAKRRQIGSNLQTGENRCIDAFLFSVRDWLFVKWEVEQNTQQIVKQRSLFRYEKQPQTQEWKKAAKLEAGERQDKVSVS